MLPAGNFLRYLFARPNSDLYAGDSDKARVFVDKEYTISFETENVECRLTTEWVDSELVEGGNGNYLKALIAIVNEYYKENRGIIRMCEQVAASGNTLILYSA